MTSSGTTKRGRAIGIVGTVARVVVGLGFLYLALTDFGSPEWELKWYSPVLGLIAFPGVLMLGQALRLRYTTSPLNATDPVAFCLGTAVAAVLIAIDFTRDAALLFYGSSLLLASLRGYAGCEVLAISNWLLRRDDQVGCLVFSPVDAVEARVTGKTTATAN